MSFGFGMGFPRSAPAAGGPSLNLQFAGSTTLDSQVTFTRALNTATYFDSTGTLVTANANVPRFDYNPTTLAARGLLIEEQRVNSIRNNTMVGAVAGTPGNAPINWSRSASPTSGISNEIVGTGTESGITYIDLRFSGTATATFSFNINLETTTQVAALPSQTWTASTYVKLTAGVLNGATISFTVGEYSSVPAFLRNNFSSTTTPTSAGLATQRAAYSLTTGASTASIQPQIAVNVANGLTYNFTIRIGLPQLEQGAFATSVIPSSPTFVSRASTGTFFDSAGVLQSAAINVARNSYNPANLSMPPMLLLEEARTNLATYSAQFDNTAWVKTNIAVTPNSITAPDGLLTADLQTVVTTGAIGLFQTVPITFSTLYTGSAYFKSGTAPFWFIGFSDNVNSGVNATVNASTLATASTSFGGWTGNSISVTAAGNGWYRVSLTALSNTDDTITNLYAMHSNAALSNTGTINQTGYVWGAQLEAGAFPTSYIPTTTAAIPRSADLFTQATVTRSADVASVNTLTPWYNATEGTLFVEGTLVGGAASTFPYMTALVGAAPNNDSIGTSWTANSGSMRFGVRSGGVPQADIAFGLFKAAGASFKVAGRYAANDFQAASDGVLGVADTSGSLPTITALSLGGAAGFQPAANTYIRRITYYPRRLTNAELQAITA